LAKYGRVLVLLDACHSGDATGDGSALTSNADLLRSIIAASNVTVLTLAFADAIFGSATSGGNAGHEPYRAGRIPCTDHPHPDDVGSLDAAHSDSPGELIGHRNYAECRLRRCQHGS
jgi:hypothetical protein